LIFFRKAILAIVAVIAALIWAFYFAAQHHFPIGVVFWVGAGFWAALHMGQTGRVTGVPSPLPLQALSATVPPRNLLK
jgi:hypothetical protein